MSNTKLVTYDLMGDDKNYKDLIQAIESYNHVKINLSCYAIETLDSHEVVFDNLVKHVDKNDRLFVTLLKAGSKWRNMIGDSEAYKSMKK